MQKSAEFGRGVLAVGVAAVMFAACAAQAETGKDMTAFVKAIDPELIKPNPVDPNKAVGNYDGTSVNRINTEKPDVILIGNSMMDMGIDAGSFAQQSGLKTVRLGVPGAMCTWQFLAIKNAIGSATHKPKFVVIIERYCIFTTPNARASGDYRPGLDAISGPKEKEKLLHQLAYAKPAIGFPNVGGDPALWDFAKVGEDSFLPYMLRMAKDQGYTLVIVRHKNRPEGQCDEKFMNNPIRLKYAADLRAYVEANGGVFLDYVPYDALKLQHYKDGDHLNRDGKRIWTAKLAEDMKALAAKAASAKK